jgi:twitching motility protein PilT
MSNRSAAPKGDVTAAEGSTLFSIKRDGSGPTSVSRADRLEAAPLSADIRSLVEALLKYNASDLHLKVGRPPLFRIAGRLIAAKTVEVTSDLIKGYVGSLLNERQVRELETRRSIDFSFRLRDSGRFRCNVYYQRGQLALAIRTIPVQVPKLETLGIPEVACDLAMKNRGLLLITGATGMGKSTTLAALVQHLNETQPLHILTLEDPIEFVFSDAISTVTQREVGVDVPSFEDGLVSALRQDPDVIVIGELRDRKMMEIALTAAETGHLVISTLHTSDAKSTIDRVIDVFPLEAQNQIRIQLADALVGVVSQQLVPDISGDNRVLATEVMVKSPHIQQLILKNELGEIADAIASSNTYYHMNSMNQSLESLIKAGKISVEMAIQASPSPEDLRLALDGLTRDRKF